MKNGWIKQRPNGELYGRVVTRQIDFEFFFQRNPHHAQNTNAPAFHVVTKSRSGAMFEIGVAFAKRTKQDKEFYSISIDDPALAAPLYVTAFASDDTGPDAPLFDIVWQRPRKKEAA